MDRDSDKLISENPDPSVVGRSNFVICIDIFIFQDPILHLMVPGLSVYDYGIPPDIHGSQVITHFTRCMNTLYIFTG
jgi:hypothetical protein